MQMFKIGRKKIKKNRKVCINYRKNSKISTALYKNLYFRQATGMGWHLPTTEQASAM